MDNYKYLLDTLNHYNDFIIEYWKKSISLSGRVRSLEALKPGYDEDGFGICLGNAVLVFDIKKVKVCPIGEHSVDITVSTGSGKIFIMAYYIPSMTQLELLSTVAK